MNPAIHYPGWYAQDPGWEEEFGDVLKGGSLTMVQPFTTFDSRNFAVHCTPQNWIASTTSPQQFDRLIELARRVFTRLGETPLSAFGLNLDFADPLRSGARGLQYARESLGVPVGLDLSGFTLKGATTAKVISGMQVIRTINVVATLADGVATLNVNADHQLPSSKDKFQHFDFAEVLDEHLDAVDSIQRLVDLLLMTEKEST